MKNAEQSIKRIMRSLPEAVIAKKNEKEQKRFSKEE